MLRKTIAWGLVTAVGLLGGCHTSNDEPQAGGFSNWLQACEQDTECGEARCLCGVCTAPCEDDSECSADSTDGACLDPGQDAFASRCANAAIAAHNARGICLATCGDELDCGPELACREGACVNRVGLLRNPDGPKQADDAQVPMDAESPNERDGGDPTLPPDGGGVEPVTPDPILGDGDGDGDGDDDGDGDGDGDGTVTDFEAGVPMVDGGGDCSLTDAGPGDDCDGCPPGQDICDDMCIPIDYDPDNCGGCGVSCGGFVCDFGTCRGATGWQRRELVGGTTGDMVGDPVLTADGLGNALVAWTQSDGAFADVWASRYDASAGQWLAAEQVGEAEFDSASNVQAASADTGSMVAWIMQNGSREVVYVRMLDGATGSWSAATEVPGQSLYNASNLALAMAPNGDAMLTWYESGDYYSAHYDGTSSTFADAQALASTVGPNGGALHMYAHDSGDFVVAWLGGGQAHALRYDTTSETWGLVEQIDSVNPGVSVNLQLSGGPGDGVSAMWKRGGRAWWTRYNATAGAWEVATLTRNGPTNPDYMSFAMDHAGVAHMTYFQAQTYWWKRYDPATDTWSAAEALDFTFGFRAVPLSLVLTASGDMFMATSTDRYVLANRYDAANGMVTPRERLADHHTFAPTSLGATLAGPGHAVFAWRHGDHIWVHRYE